MYTVLKWVSDTVYVLLGVIICDRGGSQKVTFFIDGFIDSFIGHSATNSTNLIYFNLFSHVNLVIECNCS